MTVVIDTAKGWKALLAEVIDENPTWDEFSIAVEVERRMTSDLRRETLIHLLRGEVVNAWNQRRRSLTRSAPQAASEREDGRGASPRWDRAARILEERIGSRHLPLGDLTAEQCEEIAVEYEDRARSNQAWADSMRRLARKLEDSGVTYVKQLHPQAVLQILPVSER